MTTKDLNPIEFEKKITDLNNSPSEKFFKSLGKTGTDLLSIKKVQISD